jgi:hypothetical protein
LCGVALKYNSRYKPVIQAKFFFWRNAPFDLYRQNKTPAVFACLILLFTFFQIFLKFRVAFLFICAIITVKNKLSVWGLTFMQFCATIFEHSTAQHSTAQHSV